MNKRLKKKWSIIINHGLSIAVVNLSIPDPRAGNVLEIDGTDYIVLEVFDKYRSDVSPLPSLHVDELANKRIYCK